MVATKAYNEFVNFLAGGFSPAQMVAFRPSEATRQRVLDLLFKEKNDELDDDEKSELEHYLVMEHLMRLAKVRARKFLPAA